ncbi:MAG TPA: phosphate signaling complex protein PhoU [Thermoanaerobaculia bacterium]|nr:phosphate signaling complex protein PhoU [Thermoanaerobaculia bacterium]
MSHYEERLEHDLGELKGRVLAVGGEVEDALRSAERAVVHADRALASRTILGDNRINRHIRDVDAMCHAFVARHLPSAGHLRFVSSVLRIDLELERIGDYAATICREALQLEAPPPEPLLSDFEVMAAHGRSMLSRALEAFRAGSADLARGTVGLAQPQRALVRKLFADLVREGESGSRRLHEIFALLIVLHRLERVADQAKNICEETIFAATGETKAPKTFSILFLDERNDRTSQIAEAWARKYYPKSGRYASAGWAPAGRLAPDLLQFVEQHGLDFAGTRPKDIGDLRDLLADFDVVVSLEGDPRPRLGEIPFHTVVLEWDVGGRTGPLDEVARRIAAELHALVELLRGEDAE